MGAAIIDNPHMVDPVRDLADSFTRRFPMPRRIWSRETVVAAIRAEARAGHDLCYSRTEERVPSLLRAAERVFGTWGAAVEAAGFDYASIRRYRKWSRKEVIERIQQWHEAGADLSWRHVMEELDPPLAAAALHAGRFASWNDALKAAGLDPEQIMRYRRWTVSKIQEELARLAEQGIRFDQDTLEVRAPALLAAIYRKGQGLNAQRQQLISQHLLTSDYYTARSKRQLNDR
jgi:ribosomal protein S18 acetylase RimI-like enzyme